MATLDKKPGMTKRTFLLEAAVFANTWTGWAGVQIVMARPPGFLYVLAVWVLLPVWNVIVGAIIVLAASRTREVWTHTGTITIYALLGLPNLVALVLVTLGAVPTMDDGWRGVLFFAAAIIPWVINLLAVGALVDKGPKAAVEAA